MKMFYTSLFLLSINISFAVDSDVRPGLNQCVPLMNSKKYLSKDFHTYPREVIFDCVYECNSNNKIQAINGITKVVISNANEDAFFTSCQGVMLKKVVWGYNFDKIVPFYAPETNLVEIKRWAFENINFNPSKNAQEKEKLEGLKKTLFQVGTSFVLAGTSGVETSAYFKEAGEVLLKISKDLPMETDYLDNIIKNIVEKKGATFPIGTPESLIYPVINSAASWRIPTHLYLLESRK